MGRVAGPGGAERRVTMPVQTAGDGEGGVRRARAPAGHRGHLPHPPPPRRWRQLADCYFGQQLACYPVGYLDGRPTVGRILETVERYEEDLTDTTRVHSPLRVVIDVGPAIEVSPDRPRGGAEDALMAQLRQR